MNKCRVDRTQTYTLVEIVGYEVVEARIPLTMETSRMSDAFYKNDTEEAKRKTEIIINGAGIEV